MLAQAVMPVVFVLGERLSLRICQSRLESATVTESLWKQREWNAVNPSS